MKKILIVDDEDNMRKILSLALKKRNYEVATASSAIEGLKKISGFSPDMIVSDIKMDKMNGLEFLRNIRINYGGIPVCFITAYGSIQGAVEAMKLGAVDYLEKPFDIGSLIEIIEENSITAKEKSEKVEIIGSSEILKNILKIAKKVANTDATVLIKGETGVGKDLIAQFIHQNSNRSKGPFVKVDCTAIPSELFESELFGHKKGAFTGAIDDRIGKFEVADTGTIFLDEIGTLNLDMQKKFLRIIQEKILVRIGEAKERSIDIRIITATNSDLEKMVTAGKFRKDLYFRLKHFEIFISPLKNRNEDVKELIDFFLNRYNEKYKEKKTISEIGLEKLLQYDYPGNIRELENILEQAYIISDTKIISKNDLIFTNLAEEDSDNTMDMNLRKMEKQLVIRALKITGGNLSKAAKILGINRNQLAYKLEKYN